MIDTRAGLVVVLLGAVACTSPKLPPLIAFKCGEMEIPCGNGCIPAGSNVTCCASRQGPQATTSSYCVSGTCYENTDHRCDLNGTPTQFCCGPFGAIGSNDCHPGTHHCGLATPSGTGCVPDTQIGCCDEKSGERCGGTRAVAGACIGGVENVCGLCASNLQCFSCPSGACCHGDPCNRGGCVPGPACAGTHTGPGPGGGGSGGGAGIGGSGGAGTGSGGMAGGGTDGGGERTCHFHAEACSASDMCCNGIETVIQGGLCDCTLAIGQTCHGHDTEHLPAGTNCCNTNGGFASSGTVGTDCGAGAFPSDCSADANCKVGYRCCDGFCGNGTDCNCAYLNNWRSSPSQACCDDLVETTVPGYLAPVCLLANGMPCNSPPLCSSQSCVKGMTTASCQ